MNARKWSPALAVVLATVAVAMVCASGVPESPAFPSREIRLIVPYAAGGASDRTARQIAAIAAKYEIINQPIVVTNIPGAGTVEGLRQVNRARPDGHTLLLHHNVFITMQLLDLLDQDITWEAGFTPVAQVLETPLTVAVLAGSRWNSFADLVAEVRARPGEVKFGFPGVGSPQSFGFQALIHAYAQREGSPLQIHPVYYQGGALIRTAIMQDEIDVVPGISMDTVPDAKAGVYRLLAVGTQQRIPSLAGVPTVEEAGFPMPVDAGGQSLRMSVWAPPQTPGAIVAQLDAILRRVVETPDWAAFVESVAGIPAYRDAAELARVFKSDENALRAVVPVIRGN